MCPRIREHTVNGKSEYVVPSESGLNLSDGRIGEPIPLEETGAQMVRHHKGLSTISVSTLLMTQELPGTFCALKREDLEGYTVTLSCDLTSASYAALISMLETTPSMVGPGVSVAVVFEPTTPNLVPQDTAQNI